MILVTQTDSNPRTNCFPPGANPSISVKLEKYNSNKTTQWCVERNTSNTLLPPTPKIPGKMGCFCNCNLVWNGAWVWFSHQNQWNNGVYDRRSFGSTCWIYIIKSYLKLKVGRGWRAAHRELLVSPWQKMSSGSFYFDSNKKLSSQNNFQRTDSSFMVCEISFYLKTIWSNILLTPGIDIYNMSNVAITTKMAKDMKREILRVWSLSAPALVLDTLIQFPPNKLLVIWWLANTSRLALYLSTKG